MQTQYDDLTLHGINDPATLIAAIALHLAFSENGRKCHSMFVIDPFAHALAEHIRQARERVRTQRNLFRIHLLEWNNEKVTADERRWFLSSFRTDRLGIIVASSEEEQRWRESCGEMISESGIRFARSLATGFPELVERSDLARQMIGVADRVRSGDYSSMFAQAAVQVSRSNSVEAVNAFYHAVLQSNVVEMPALQPREAKPS